MEMGSLEKERMMEKSKEEEEEEEEGGDEIYDIAEQGKCVTISKRRPFKRREEFSWEKYGPWALRQAHKFRAARLEKQLRATWALEELLKEELNRFDTIVPTRLKDVGELIMPKCVPSHELATSNWFGDWRPSSIVGLLISLTTMSKGSSSLESASVERSLSQQLRELRIEEAVIDEEMAEIQARCIVHLPFGPMNHHESDASSLAFLQPEFKKIQRVISRAQNLRFKALEVVVKKLLGEADAAEFLIAFSGIQDLIHQFAAQLKLRKGPVLVPVKALGSGYEL